MNERKTILRISVMLLAFLVASATVNVKSAFAQGTIYIRPDGSIDPPTAPIRRFGDSYTFTADVYDSIVVQRDSVTVDGGGFTLQGTGAGIGFDLWGRMSVTVKNTYVTGFQTGIYVHDGANFNALIDNTIVYNAVAVNLDGLVGSTAIISNVIANNSGYGIRLHDVSGTDIWGNIITGNAGGISVLFGTGDFFGNTFTNNSGSVIAFQAFSANLIGNTIVNNTGGVGGLEGYDLHNSNVRGNIISGNGFGLDVQSPTYNKFDGNTITSNGRGISLWGMTVYANNVTNNDIISNDIGFQIDGQGGNVIYHNNFVNNTQQAVDPNIPPEVQVWDNGYPSGGNYWSDYDGNDYYSGPSQDQPGSDGIGDTAYIVNAWETWINKDNYPLMNSVDAPLHILTITHTTGGVTDPASGVHPYTSGAVAAVTATSQNGYFFDHWELDNVNVGSINPLSVTMETNHALHAVFAAKPVLTISATAGGTTDPLPGSYIHDLGSVVAVTAVPQSDYLFDYWTLDNVNIGSANPISLTMDTNHFLNAVFRPMSDIAIKSVSPYPTSVRRGELVYVDVNVENRYGSIETFDVVVYADKDRRTIGDEIVIGTQTISGLTPGDTRTSQFTWETSSTQSSTGYYISAKAVVAYDLDQRNNLLTAKKKVFVRG